MTPQELGVFLREEVPSLEVTSKLPLTHQLLSALDAAVGLLREAHDALNLVHPQTPDGCVIDNTIATLRLVVGEKERSPNG